MKMVAVFKFTALDESIKQIAMKVAMEYPGVTKVVDVKGELDQLEARGEFSTFELTKELKKIDESFDTIKIGPDVFTEPEVKPHQQDKAKRPINKQEPSKTPNVDASSSNWTGLWDQAKGYGAAAAGQAKVMGVGAAEKAKVIGAVAGLAAEQAKVIGVGAAEKAKAIHGVAVGYLEKRKRLEKDRRYYEWLKEEDINQRKNWQENKKIWQEKDKREQDLEKKSEGGTTLGSVTTGLWKSTSTLLTGQTSAFMQSLRTGQTSASTQGKKESQPVERKGKNGKYYLYND